MEIKEKIVRYISEFNDDPLYKRIEEKGLLDELLSPPSYFETIDFADAYSTKIATELLNMQSKDQTIINYINRPDFKDYIQIARRANRFYRFDWKSLFKFKMIFLLNREGYSPMDLATLIGKVTDVVQTEGLSSTDKAVPIGPSLEEIVKATKEEMYPVLNKHVTNSANYRKIEKKLDALLIKRNEINTNLLSTESSLRLANIFLLDKQSYIEGLRSKQDNDKGFFASLFGSSKNNDTAAQTEYAEALIKKILNEIDTLNTLRDSYKQACDEIDREIVHTKEKLLLEADSLKLMIEMKGEMNDDNVLEQDE